MIKNFLKVILKKFGITLGRVSNSDIGRRMLLIKGNKINKVVDVGANIGQYASEIRSHGFNGEIISFEPLKDAFLELQSRAKKDCHWVVFNRALGDKDGTVFINVSENSVSSSINNIKDIHTEAAPDSTYIRRQEIEINRLDSLLNDVYNDGDIMMLKIDTQGFEKNVIDGAENFLKKTYLLQLEMSLVPMYENEMLISEMINYLKCRNFEIISLENGFFDYRSGRLFQVDGIFINKNLK